MDIVLLVNGGPRQYIVGRGSSYIFYFFFLFAFPPQKKNQQQKKHCDMN